MKILKFVCLVCLSLSLTSCNRSNKQFWEDTKTCGSYVGKGFACLFGSERQRSAKELRKRSRYGSFVALKEDVGDPLVLTASSSQISKNLLLEEDEVNPKSFTTPTGKMAHLLKNVHFATDSYTIQNATDIQNLKEIARILIKNPRIKLFIEGHTDIRGTSAYNIALGARRANSVKTFLQQQGVNPDRLFTVSYGKEKPLVQGNTEDVWKKNRRTEFKLHTQ